MDLIVWSVPGLGPPHSGVMVMIIVDNYPHDLDPAFRDKEYLYEHLHCLSDLHLWVGR
jgi:hypothetical protein